MTEDRDLLRDYVLNGSQPAFAALVARHIDLVFAAARRLVGESHLAKDVTQMVFIHLAQRAATVRDGNALPGWLYRVTCSMAANVLRAEHRRREGEREAVNLGEFETDASAAWAAVEPLLDEAMRRLSSAEQDAVVLRYFEGKNLREVGVALGLSDDAAQKRVSRALDKMRGYFVRHGVTATVALLATLITANAVQAAPVGLAASVAGAAFTGAGATGAFGSLLKTLSVHKIRTTVLVAILAGGLAVTVAWYSMGQGTAEKNAVPLSSPNEPSLHKSATAPDLPGTLTLEAPVDLSWNSNGSQFQLNSMRVGAKETISVHCEGTISQVADGYFLDYNLNWQVFSTSPAVEAGQPVVSKDDFEMQSTALLKPNKPFTLLRANGKTITLMTDGQKVTLTLTKPAGI